MFNFKTSVNEVVIGAGRIHSKLVRTSYSYPLQETVYITARLRNITNFSFYIWGSRKTVVVPSSGGDALSKSHTDVDASVADLPDRGASNGVERHPDISLDHEAF